MAELKTQKNNASVSGFIAKVPDLEQRKDAKAISAILRKITGKPPKMWGTSIIGFDEYHYKSARSSQEGDWPMIGFSPRKANTTVYLMAGLKAHSALLKKLGKHKISGGSCLYIKRLSDLDIEVFKKLLAASYREMKRRHG